MTQVSTIFRPLVVDVQVRALNDLDMQSQAIAGSRLPSGASSLNTMSSMPASSLASTASSAHEQRALGNSAMAAPVQISRNPVLSVASRKAVEPSQAQVMRTVYQMSPEKPLRNQ